MTLGDPLSAVHREAVWGHSETTATGEAGGSLSLGAHPDGSLQNRRWRVSGISLWWLEPTGTSHTLILTAVPGRPGWDRALPGHAEKDLGASHCVWALWGQCVSAGLVTITASPDSFPNSVWGLACACFRDRPPWAAAESPAHSALLAVCPHVTQLPVLVLQR